MTLTEEVAVLHSMREKSLLDEVMDLHARQVELKVKAAEMEASAPVSPVEPEPPAVQRIKETIRHGSRFITTFQE